MDAFQRPAFHQVFLSENMSFVEASNCEFIIQFITLLVAFDRLYICSLRTSVYHVRPVALLAKQNNAAFLSQNLPLK